MKDPVSVECNRENFKFVCEKLNHLDYFPFFGTLLGLTRQGDMIPNDDDIDFLVNIDHRQDIIEICNSSEININFDLEMNQSPYYLRGERSINGNDTIIDFYFFENHPNNNYLIDKWNFTGKYLEPHNTIHIPKNLIYPIQQKQYFGVSVKIPQMPEQCCQFLYGKSWKIPLTKSSEYKTLIVNHKPRIFTKSPADKALRFFARLWVSFQKRLQ